MTDIRFHTEGEDESQFSEGVRQAPVVAWLGESGAYCDCEVSANVGSEWEGRL